jgi:hypothetical protein
MMADELTLARSGALDTDLLAQQPSYGTNVTKPLLFIEDGQYFVNRATAMSLSGSQWGVMNETGSYDRDLHDRPDDDPAPAGSVHPRPARRPPAHPRAQAHLATVVSDPWPAGRMTVTGQCA